MEESKKTTAQSPNDPVEACAHFSRLIGGDTNLVLHGGGNSSVKASRPDITGQDRDAIYVKGSGWDMGSLEVPGLTPLDLPRLKELLELGELSDVDMMRELSAAKLDPGSPNPSVETLLHAFIPYRAVQHSHADVIVTLTNLADMNAPDEVVRDIFGDEVIVIPYVMPGFDLAQEVRENWVSQFHDGTRGMVLLNHGLFTFGDDSQTAYEMHMKLIKKAETWLEREAPVAPQKENSLPSEILLTDLARLRYQMSNTAGKPMIVRRHTDSEVAGFVQRDDYEDLARRGPLTPDHIIRTKRFPMVGASQDSLDLYVQEYESYVEEFRHRVRTEFTEIDPAPRIVLDPEIGMLTAGFTAKDAQIAADIYHHTIPVLCRSEDHLGGYKALSAEELFDVEYWDLEQAKLRKSGKPPELSGTVSLVTGAASGIGKACAEELKRLGSAVIGVDLNPEVNKVFVGDDWVGVEADVTKAEEVDEAIKRGVERFGGLDIAVVAAGIFGNSAAIEDLDSEEWRRVMSVNVDSVQSLFGSIGPLLALSPIGGRVAVIGSKNVPAPGKGAAAYSASKAALQQLCRVAALEWAPKKTRVNMVHPDAVFDTGLWSEELIAERASSYGISPEEYKKRNLLSVEVTSKAVARSAISLCTDDFSTTTGASVPTDGGSDRVI
ncbi:MAG: bifunctional aldolase/short-chain dehydrogenase [Acidimicrobiales bacterium]|nr:bifunctional aldolase/short-chain dehydrogenase [Acidimicrobiaceae bacterium]MDP6162057.1 bifunctional aldolase/short-chain dehydrogenase [Acidimicrobiales bacterium]